MHRTFLYSSKSSTQCYNIDCFLWEGESWIYFISFGLAPTSVYSCPAWCFITPSSWEDLWSRIFYTQLALGICVPLHRNGWEFNSGVFCFCFFLVITIYQQPKRLETTLETSCLKESKTKEKYIVQPVAASALKMFGFKCWHFIFSLADSFFHL